MMYRLFEVLLDYAGRKTEERYKNCVAIVMAITSPRAIGSGRP